MNISRYEPYLVEIVRLIVLVIFVSFSGYFIRILPFIEDLSFIKDGYTLGEFIEFLAFGTISFLLVEFSFRVQKSVDDIVRFIPRCGIIHRYLIFIISGVFLYSGWLNTFIKLVGNDWVWLYQLFFAGFTIGMFVVIFMIIYREGDNFGRNILEKFKEII